MTIKDLEKRLDNFITNEFAHLRTKVDWIFYSIITLLLGTIASLVILIIKK